MCFYVNLRELWPFGSFFSRPSNKSGNKESGRGARKRNNNNDNNGHKTDVDGKFPQWNKGQLAPHWLTNEATQKHCDRQTHTQEGDANRVGPAKHTDQKHYGNNLLESVASGGTELGLNAGRWLKHDSDNNNTKKDTKVLIETNQAIGGGVDGKRRSEHERVALGPNVAATRGATGRSTMSGQQVSTTTTTSTNNNNQQDQDDFHSTKQKPGTLAEPQQQHQQQLQEQLNQNADQLPEPSAEALAAASKFKVRTARRRHLDFDDEFDLTNASAPQRSKWSGPFHFIQAADCQFGMIDSYVHHRTQPGWREEIELCERLVELCHRMQPKPLFMIICGDLVDSLPASEIGRRQVVDFKRIFAKLDPTIPLVCVCGNHDVGDEPTSKTVNDYRQTFGDDYFYFTKNDILFIVINSQFYQNRNNVQEEARQQDCWLESLLAKCKLFKYSIIFEHIPWFLAEANEDNDYFNIRKEVRLEWLRKFKDAGVTKIMCGHYHRNAGGWFEGMELIVTSAIGAQCGTDKSGIRIVRVLDKSIEHQYYAMDDVPLQIELNQ